MSQKNVLLLVLVGIFQTGFSESTLHLLTRIAEQGFGQGFGTDTRDRADTLILWGVEDTLQAGLYELPYPKFVFDSVQPINESVRARCLVFMDLTATEESDIVQLLQNAFLAADRHYEAKYVILLAFGVDLAENIVLIGDTLSAINIVDYAMVLYEANRVKNVGYMKGSQFNKIRPGDPLSLLYEGRLEGLILRALVTETKPYAYVTHNRTAVEGVDVEINSIVASKLGVNLNWVLYDQRRQDAFYIMLFNGSADMCLTRRKCNMGLKLPQLHLDHRFKVQLMMPRALRVSYNLQFLKPYQPEVWYMILVMAVVGAVMNWIFLEKIQLNWMMVVVFSHGQNATRHAAVLVVALEFFKFILLESYSGQVTSFMIQLRYQENPQTLEQFFESDTLLNEPMQLANFLSQLGGDLSAQMLKKLKGTRNVNQTSAYELGYAYIVSEHSAIMLQSDQPGSELQYNFSHFYVIDQPLQEVPMCYYFGKWSIFVRKFAEVHGRLDAGGIMVKFQNDARHLTRLLPEINTSSVLLFNDLVPVFFFVCYGWLLGVGLLVVELAVHRMSQYGFDG